MIFIVADDRTDYGHVAQAGDVCQICHVRFMAGEVVTAVTSGGVTGLHCGDVEECLSRFRESAQVDGRYRQPSPDTRHGNGRLPVAMPHPNRHTGQEPLGRPSGATPL